MRVMTAAVVLCVVLIAAYQPVFFSRWDQAAKDLLTGWAGGSKLSNRVVIVAIDDRSLQHYGRWPWPRDLLSELLRTIQQARPDTVVLDMMFPEADLGKPAVVGRGAAAGSSAPLAATNDDQLAAALQDGRYVIGLHFDFASDPAASTACRLEPLRFATVHTESTRTPASFIASGVQCSVRKLRQASAAEGFLNAAPDRDGLLRRIPLVIEYRGNTYPSLALAGYLVSRRIDNVQLWTGSSGSMSLRMRDVEIPVDSKADLLLRFRRRGALTRFSAADVLKGNVPKPGLQDKIVVVGLTALGLQDVVPTTVDALLPGVEVHATAIDNLLQNDGFRAPRGAFAEELALLFAMALLSGVLVNRLSPVRASLTTGCLLLALWSGCLITVKQWGIVVSPFPATVVLAGNLLLLGSWRLATEKRREEQQVRRTREFIFNVVTSLTRIRDLETGAHILRVQRYAKLLCETIASQPAYRRLLTPKTIQLIHDLIPLHDIGKVAVPDRILRHPGQLSPEDYEIIKSHVMQGYTVFADAARRSGLDDDVAIRLATDIILAHHERWNGTGYPLGLTGENIALVGRITAVADVYDAIVCKRVYKDAMDHQSAVNFIVSNRGTLFDPMVVDAFVKVEKQIHQVMSSLTDESAKAATC